MTKATRHYPLGHSEDEGRRLADQAAQIDDLTEVVFRRAGLRPGMRVLDVGSGMGDVAILAAKIVGSDGAIVGIEKSADFVAAANLRAAGLGLANLHFEQADVDAFETAETFDAIVGRFVLSYLPDRVATLRQLLRHLRPGGIVAFQELDMTEISQSPPSALFGLVRHWLLAAFVAGGTDLATGGRLRETFVQAGLPEPETAEISPVLSASDAGAYEGLVRTLRSLLPTIERYGIVSLDEIGIDTLAERLRADAAAHGRRLGLSRIVGAWTSSSFSSSPNLG